jgi:hypothetical protein
MMHLGIEHSGLLITILWVGRGIIVIMQGLMDGKMVILGMVGKVLVVKVIIVILYTSP